MRRGRHSPAEVPALAPSYFRALNSSRLSGVSSSLSGTSRRQGRWQAGISLGLPHEDMPEQGATAGTHSEYTKQVKAGGMEKQSHTKADLGRKIAAKAVRKLMAPKKKHDRPPVYIDHRYLPAGFSTQPLVMDSAPNLLSCTRLVRWQILQRNRRLTQR